MPLAASSQKWIEFFSTILGAVVVAFVFPETSGVLLMFGTMLFAVYRLLRAGRSEYRDGNVVNG